LGCLHDLEDLVKRLCFYVDRKFKMVTTVLAQDPIGKCLKCLLLKKNCWTW